MAYRGPDPKPESLTAIESLNGGDVKVEARNTSNTSSSDATLTAQVAGTSAGDAKVALIVSGTTTWTVGADNSDSDSLKIGPNVAVGTSTAITVTTAGVTTVGSLAATNASLTTPTIASATLTGVLDIPRGSISVPSISFTGDANTGIYSSAADNIQLVAAGAVGVKADADGGKLLDGSGNEMVSNSGGTTVIASNGTQRFTASSSGVTVATVGIITPIGSNTAPSHTFTGDTNTGMYSSGADTIDFTTGGTKRLTINSSGNVVAAGTVTASNGALIGASDTGTVTSTMILDGTIVNADINASAAIATSKLAAVTASRALVSDASGFVTASTASTTQLQYLSSASGTTGTTSTNLVFSASPTLTGVVSHDVGSASAPSITFVGDTNTGMSAATADTLVLSTAGTEALRVSSSQLVFLGGSSAAAAAGTPFFTVNNTANSSSRQAIHGHSSGTSYTGDLFYGHTVTTGTGFNFCLFSTPGNVKWKVVGDGQTYADNTYVGTGADFAEMMEWVDGNPNNEDRVGQVVTLENGKIRQAIEGDMIVGVISAMATIVGNGAWSYWSGKYLRDRFGRKVLDEAGEEVLNPDYVEGTEYIARNQRKEWSPVGLIGILRVLKNQQISPNWIKLKDIDAEVAEYLVK